MANKSKGTWYVAFELPRGKGDRNISERARGQEIRESEIGRHAKCQRGHTQSSSAETDDRDKTDTRMARTSGRAEVTAGIGESGS